MSLCSGHDSNVARGGDSTSVFPLPTGEYEDSVVRPLSPNVKPDELNLGVLGRKNPTVMITRTKLVPGVTPLRTSSVDSGATLVEADAVQGLRGFPTSRHRNSNNNNNNIAKNNNRSVQNKYLHARSYEKKENLFILKKLKNSNQLLSWNC